MIYCCRQTREHYLITEFKDMEDFLRPQKDSRIKLHIFWLNDVDIQEVDQSTVGFLSEYQCTQCGGNYVRIDIR